MKLYWKKRKKGYDLCVEDDNGQIFVVGGTRHTRRGGIEALAKTTTYDPGRSIRNLPSFEEGRQFVERFEPWRELFPGESMEVESEIQSEEGT